MDFRNRFPAGAWYLSLSLYPTQATINTVIIQATAYFKKRSVACCMIVLLLCSGSSSWGQEGPPLITDDTGTPGNNKWEIDIAITSEIRHPDQRQFEMPLLDINYGIGENVELSYEVPLLVSANRKEAVLSGLGDSEVGIKWRFIDESKAPLSASITRNSHSTTRLPQRAGDSLTTVRNSFCRSSSKRRWSTSM